MNQVITQHKFMNYVRQYREKGLGEVTQFAARSAFNEYQNGNKNLLIQKMEQAFGRPIEDQYFTWGLGAIADNTLDGDFVHNKEGNKYSGVDYSSDAMVKLILDPIHNEKRKSESFKKAYIRGYRFCLLNCHIHGESIHRANFYVKKVKGEPRDHYQGYCLYCYAERMANKEDRKAAIDLMHKKFYENITKLEGEPCQNA